MLGSSLNRAAAVLLGVLLALHAQQAHAQERLQEPETLAPGKPLIVAGEKGRWWPLPTALRLAEEHLEVHVLRKLIESHETLAGTLSARIAEKDTRIRTWQRAHSLLEAQANTADRALEAAIRGQLAAQAHARQLEAKLVAWYRHPALWFAAGAVVTVAALGAGYALAH